MILQRLCQAASWAASKLGFAPPGYQKIHVKWIVDLNTDGRCLGIVRTTSGDGKYDKEDPGIELICPYVRRTNNVVPWLLVDRADYALGLAPPDADKRDLERIQKQHQAFVELLTQCAEQTNLAAVRTVQRALTDRTWQDHVPEDLSPKDILTFRVTGQLLIDHPQVRAFWDEYIARIRTERSSQIERCLVCGQVKPIADRHPIPIKPIPGGQSSGCVLVGANETAFESYGRKASFISPVCWDCAETYAMVLNAFLASDQHHYRLRDHLVYVFWTREPSTFNMNTLLFASAPDPGQVRNLLESVENNNPKQALKPDESGGRSAQFDPNQFFALALSGSDSRLVIRDWIETTVGHVRKNIGRYFRAQAIVDPDGQEGQPLGLFQLLSGLIPSRKTAHDPWKTLPRNLPTQFVHAVLTGQPLPDTLLYRAVARARADQSVTRPRAAMIKLCLLLSAHKKEGLELTEELNPALNDPAYLCGRLLAILEHIQRAALGRNVNATIIDRFYGTASAAPASVFGLLMRQAQAHLANLRKNNEPAYHRLQQQLEEVASRLPAFPKVLKLNEQGLFALGYYQQRAADRAARAEAIAAKQAAEAEQPDEQIA